jgi:hypothetical protein
MKLTSITHAVLRLRPELNRRMRFTGEGMPSGWTPATTAGALEQEFLPGDDLPVPLPPQAPKLPGQQWLAAIKHHLALICLAAVVLGFTAGYFRICNGINSRRRRRRWKSSLPWPRVACCMRSIRASS